MKQDNALNLLLQTSRSMMLSECLWVIDEQTDVELLVSHCDDLKKPFLLTQRYDQIRRWRDVGGVGIANDYDFSGLAKFQYIFFRIPKEKALMHYIVNQSLMALPVGGTLYIAGAVNEGAKSLFEKLRDIDQLQIEISKGDKKNLLAQVKKISTLDQAVLDDRDYADWFELQYDDPDTPTELQTFVSKPGIYGWDKLDVGTELLWQTLLDTELQYITEPQSILDLGCGYGWLIVQAGLQWPEAELVATDNNVTALMAVQHNAYRFGLAVHVVAANVADEIDQTFDLIVCNPPFHQGFDVEGDLTQAFLRAAAKRLNKKGQAYFVVNSFIPLEKKALGIFSTINTLVDTKKFKVVRFSHG